MPSELYIGGGVYVNIPAISDIYWPVVGVTKPQHLWPFNLTGDYTDHGSTGGLDLSAQGAGNSFGADGLILNGSGYARAGSINSDVNNIGSIFSVLIDFKLTDATDTFQCSMAVGDHDDSAYNWEMWTPWTANDWQWQVGGSGGLAYDVLTSDTWHQLVFTYDDGGLKGKFYVDGEVAIGEYTGYPTENLADYLAVGALSDGSYKMIGTVRRAGVLKGTAWSADDVAAIYAAL